VRGSRPPVVWASSATVDYLDGLMKENYQVKNLVGVDGEAFHARIDAFLNMDDSAMEGFAVADQQRGYAIKFHWSHYHDFGDFVVEGMNRDRHERLIANFIDTFAVLPRHLEGKRVLDIGCWTGGTSLVLAAMGATVLAVEEVKKYTESLRFLKESFAISHLDVRNLSLYDLRSPEYEGQFDFVLFGGVLYHLSDMILGLRIIFNALKDGGRLLLETATAPQDKVPGHQRLLAYGGTDPFGQRPPAPEGGRVPNPEVMGASWFFPTERTLREMMIDVGFADVRSAVTGEDRASAVGTKKRWVDMMRAGLSVRDIR
jgi:2-polyprenyl-3-methyl-5-hydroxy-6-metoxy-1,4-benzoquinol methylase